MLESFLRLLQYALSTPSSNTHFYLENYIPTSTLKAYSRNDGSWITKAYKKSSNYLMKIQNFEETWREVVSADLIRTLTFVHSANIACAPKVKLLSSYFTQQTYLLSKSLEGFIDLYQYSENNNLSPNELRQFLLKLENFPEIIAACFLTGLYDMHSGNLGIVKHNNKLYMAKVDHGRAFSRSSTLKFKSFISACLRDYTSNGLPVEGLLSLEFAYKLEAFANKATDSVIISSLAKGFKELSQHCALSHNVPTLEELVHKIRANKFALLDLAKLIKLHCCLKNNDTALFKETLTDELWYFYSVTSELHFPKEVKQNSKIHPHFELLEKLIMELPNDERSKNEFKEIYFAQYKLRTSRNPIETEEYNLPVLNEVDQTLLQNEQREINKIQRRQHFINYALYASFAFVSFSVASHFQPLLMPFVYGAGIVANSLWSAKSDSHLGTILMATSALCYFANATTSSMLLTATAAAPIISHSIISCLPSSVTQKISEYSTHINYTLSLQATQTRR